MNDSSSKNGNFNETGCLYASLFPICFGMFLLLTREANLGQLIFRCSLIVLGVIGLVTFFVVKSRKDKQDE